MTAAFTEALLGARRPVIMELKRQDAAGRDLFAGRSVRRIVTAYEDAGAPCLSVVTGHWFGGTRDLLHEVARTTELPLLQKDFITRRSQLQQAVDDGASAVLLTAALLARSTLGNLVEHALRLGLTPFVEVTTEAEALRVPRGEDCVIAVSNKDIATRERGTAQIGRSADLLPALRRTGTPCPVSASGIDRPDVAARLVREGFAGVLIGTALLRTHSLPRWLDDFDRGCREPSRPPHTPQQPEAIR
jgi:indole-3-glycerol phosphate synthase